jgi:hypothetical protein
MLRCPNCGSSVRSGAKFCTTCGFRLPVATEEIPESGPSRSPFDLTTSSPVSPRWQASDTPTSENGSATPPAAAEPEPPGDAPAADAVAGVAVSSEGSDPSATSGSSFSGWPAFGEESGANSSWDVAAEVVPQPAPSEEAGPAAAETNVEDAVAAWSGGAAASTETPVAEQAVDSSGETEPTSVDTEDSGGDSWQTSVQPAPADQADDNASEPGVAEPITVEAAASEEEQSPASQEVAIPLQAGAIGVSDAQQKAIQLIDELRGLIPALGGAAATSNTEDGGVAADLAALLDGQEADAERFQSLRAAVATAQARPRDIDIMLDLVSRADVIAAMIAAHDRYLAGIESAVARLRGEQAKAVEPRW